MKTKLLTIPILAMLAISTFAIFPVSAAQAMFIDPATVNWTTSHVVGDRFNVTVKISGFTDQVEGVQVKVWFTPTIINITRWFEPTGDAAYIFAGRSTSALPTPPNDVGYTYVGPDAYAMISLSLFPAYPAQGYGVGNGKVCIFEFELMSLPDKLGSMSDTIDINNYDCYVIIAGDFQGDDPGEVTKTNCVFTITWAAPAAPGLDLLLTPHDAGDTRVKTYGPDPPSAIGEVLVVDTFITGLSGAWFLSGAVFRLTWNDTVIALTGIVIDPAWIGGAFPTIDPDPAVLDYADVGVSAVGAVSGDVLVATFTFTVAIQKNSPPASSSDIDTSPLLLSMVFFEDHIGPIPVGDVMAGRVDVIPLRALELPWFEVVPSYLEFGPAPVVGDEFDVGVKITGPLPLKLDEGWLLIGVQFRLFYDDTLLEVVSVTEGPFMKILDWNWYGTFYVSSVEANGLGPHVLVGDMLLPNPETGEWDMDTFPHGEGIVTTVRFKILKQLIAPCNYTGRFYESALDLTGVFGEWAINKDGDYIPVNDPVNGLVHVLETASSNGRIIDVYGGAENRGYGRAKGTIYDATRAFYWPKPYGGQGQGGNMDLVIPQSVVFLFARVTYNCWPVQQKDVGFEIEGPFYQEGWTAENPVRKPGDYPNGPFHIRKYANRSDEIGITWIKFQMLWPCENPEDLMGKYRVTVSVDICGEVVTDVLWFDYYYMVEIVSVTTDKYYYAHCNDIKVTVNYRSKAQQSYPVLFSIIAQDELETHFDGVLVEQTVKNAPWCHWANYTFTANLHAYKWAFAGFAHIYVSAYDKDPTEGGAPWLPTYGLGWPEGAVLPEIYIMSV